MSDSYEANNKYFLPGIGGRMGELIRSKDWSQTPLGSPDTWPQSLRNMVDVMLENPFGMYIAWGPEFTQIYNDTYANIIGTQKHPNALGIGTHETFEEAWHTIGPMFEQVMKGTPVRYTDLLLPLNKNGYLEDCYFDFSYSPIRDDNGKIAGVLVTTMETTHKRKVVEDLKESEERFKIMAEGTDIMIAVGDETSNAVYFNNAWTKLTGRPMNDLLEFGWADLIHPEDKERYVSIYLNAFKDKLPFSGEFRVLNKDGEYRWLLAQGPPRFRPDGSFAGYISSAIDITERKKSEAQLKRSEQRLLAVIESAPFPIGLYTGEEMRIEFTNQTILDIWGKGNDVVGKLYSEVLPELENQEIFGQLHSVYTTGVPFHARNQRVDLVVDGILQPFYFNYSFTPLYDADGQVYGVMNTAAEVTDLNLAKQKIEQSEANFRNIILQAPVAMCIMMGPDHVVEIANDSIIELWGKPASEVLYKPVFEGLPDAKGQGLEEILANVYSKGETFTANEMPVSLVRNGKPEIVYQTFVYEPYHDGNGHVLGVIATTTDVTPQVQARQKIEEIVAERTKELETANHSLHKSNAELAQFAYIASHDLQEPLRKIVTYTDMLGSRISGSIDEQSKSYLGKINTAATRMITLIRDVLSYSELSKEMNEFVPVDLNEVVQGIEADFELLIEQKGATIQYSNLPVLDAIPLQMSQLFGNMISNSLKFSRADVPPVITISSAPLAAAELKRLALDPAMQYVKIQFADNGIGFKEEHRQQIFNIFQRLHRKSEYAGTGIGLAMCKKIALNHNGDLNADGSTEAGAHFNIVLPLKQQKNNT